jgi:hypothetical protein
MLPAHWGSSTIKKHPTKEFGPVTGTAEDKEDQGSEYELKSRAFLATSGDEISGLGKISSRIMSFFV